MADPFSAAEPDYCMKIGYTPDPPAFLAEQRISLALTTYQYNKLIPFAGLRLDDELTSRCIKPRCGLQVIDLHSGLSRMR